MPDASDRVLVTTDRLASTLGNRFDLHLEPAVLDSALFELDRAGYLEFVTVTSSGDHVWDLSDTAEAVGDVLASVTAAVVGSLLEE